MLQEVVPPRPSYHCQRYPSSHPSCSKVVVHQQWEMLPFGAYQSDLLDQTIQLVAATALTRVRRHRSRYPTGSRYCFVVLQTLQR
jgi:hypothetical protein